jgi:hypothetical protein
MTEVSWLRSADTYYATYGTINVTRTIARLLSAMNWQYGYERVGGLEVTADEVVAEVQRLARLNVSVQHFALTYNCEPLIPSRKQIVTILRAMTNGKRGQYITYRSTYYLNIYRKGN